MKKKVFIGLIIILSMLISACEKINSFTIHFDSNGGTNVSYISTKGDEFLKIPDNPTKEGYVFDGWYWDNSVWDKPFTANSLLTAPISSDITVYAKWIEESAVFEISFETNGGTSIQGYKALTIISSPIITKSGFEFAGWYTKSELNESSRVSFPYVLTAETVFYAKWNAIPSESTTYVLQGDTYTVTGYTGSSTKINIPESYQGKAVAAISTRAFEGNLIITEIYIPKSVTLIGTGAFTDCYSLKKVTGCEGVATLGSTAFAGCNSLENIALSQVTNVGREAFSGCSNLKEISLSTENITIGTGVLYGCSSLSKLTINGKNEPVYFFGDKVANVPASLKEITISSGITEVPKNYFAYFSMLETLSIPNSVTKIDDAAFAYCSNLKSMTLSDNVTEIGFAPFYECNNLIDLSIPFIGKSVNDSNTSYLGYLYGAISYSTNYDTAAKNLKNLIVSHGDKINSYAFYKCEGLQSVKLPEGVKEIGNNAFYNCINLQALDIPDTVTAIGNLAFYGCSSFTSITIPSAIINIGSSAFDGCNELKEINVEAENNNYKSIEGLLYNKAETILLLCPKKINGSVTIPDGITTIDNNMFLNCSELTEIIIPNSVTSIGYSAFSGCGSLTSITLPFIGYSRKETNSSALFGYIFGRDKYIGATSTNQYYSDNSYDAYYIPDILKTVKITDTTKINFGAFSCCSNITNIIIPDSVTIIDARAFFACNGLKSLVIPDSVITIGDSAFNQCSILNNIIIPNCVTTIGSHAFWRCISLTRITIPHSVTIIKESTFSYCSKLTSITLSYYLTSIGYSAFSNSGLTSIIIPDSVTSIGSYAFYDCSELSEINVEANNNIFKSADGILYDNEVTKLIICPAGKKDTILIPDGIISIDSAAFQNCSRITNITIPDSVRNIGEYAFNGCSGLTSIIIPDSVKSIGNFAFKDSSLTSVIIPDSVTTIGDSAFSNSKLISIIIPNSVTSIGSYAFSGCRELTEINVDANNNIYKSEDGILYNNEVTKLIFCPAGKKGWILIPSSVISIDNSAFSGCSGLTSITIPSSVTSIGNSAFYDCSGLTSITVPNSVTIIEFSTFSGCSGLTSIILPESVKIIDSYAFNGCISLASITIPSSVTSIARSAFYECTGLTSIIILAKIPPLLVNSVLYNNFSSLKIYVPSDSVEQYKSASVWSSYSTKIYAIL